MNGQSPSRLRVSPLFTPLVALLLGCAAAAVTIASDDAVRVRTSSVSAPCVESAARAWEARAASRVEVKTGGLRDDGDWDVLVGSSVEVTRALEGGAAVLDSDVEIALVPWVLHVSSAGDVTTLSDAVGSGAEIAIPSGPSSYEARRALDRAGAVRVVETASLARLRSAPMALVPLSLAGRGRLLEVEVRPIRIVAAVGVRARRAREASALVGFLASEQGQDVFAACGAAQ